MAREAAAAIDRWFFYQDAASLWKWARIDVFGTVLAHSGASFATRGACVEDAQRCGYRKNLTEPQHAARSSVERTLVHVATPSRV